MKVLSKAFYITTGVIFSVIGALSIWQTVNIINTPVKSVDLELLRTNTFNSCVNLARNDKKYGLDVETKINGERKRLLISTNDLEGWDAKMYAASEILSQCHGLKMTSFCFGEECDIDSNPATKEQGMRMILEYDNGSEHIVAK